MREISKIAEALFEKIRDRFDDVTLGDENAKATQDPESARFFNFDYTVDGASHGNITISVIDENSLKVYFSKNISSDLDEEEKAKWYGFLRELREFAKRNLLSFDPRDITRSTLKHRDLQQVSKSDNTYSKDEVALGESRLHGTSRSSYEQDGDVKIIVRHSDRVDPEQRGARSRKIKALFIETADGARIKLPHNNLKYARAMAQHVSQGGQAGDDFGCHITKIAEECGKLRPFKSAMIRRTFEDAETQSMAEAAFEYHGLLNNTLKKMGGRKGYAACKESFIADDVLMDEFDVDALRERFVKRSFNDRMEEALPLVQKAYNMKKSNKFAEQFESWANTVSEGTWAKPEGEEQVAELIDLLMEPLTVGIDATNATGALYNLVGDDTLFDRLGDLAEENPEADARDVVMDWVQENMPEIYQQVMAAIGDEDTAGQQAEPEMDEGTTGAVVGGVAGAVLGKSPQAAGMGANAGSAIQDAIAEDYDDEENDSSDAVQTAIIRRIINSHSDLLSQYGPEAITNASRDVAEWVGKVEEIGSSDVSAWVKEVINNLGDNDQDIDSPDQFNRGGEMDEGIVDTVRGKNYKRLADRSFNKAMNAHDDTVKYDFADPARYPHEKEFNKQMDNMRQRTNKAKSLGIDESTASGLDAIIANNKAAVDNFIHHNELDYDLESDLHEYYYDRLSGSAQRDADDDGEIAQMFADDLTDMGLMGNVDESKMSEMDLDLDDLTDREFVTKYGHSKQEAMNNDWLYDHPESMPDPVDEAIGDDYVNKDEKMKRMGAKELSTLDKVKIMPSQMKAMAKGDSEDDLTAYNKQFNEEIAQMRKIAGIK